MTEFEKKHLENGTPNPKYIDLCDEDPSIAGQKFACLSFVSPDKILKKREVFLFDKFLKNWEFTKSMEKYFEFIHFISHKYSLNTEGLINDYNEFVKEEAQNLLKSSVEDDYKNFIDKEEDKLNQQFNKEHAFQTSVRGIKFRGAFGTQEEAENKSKQLREQDPNHDIFVGPVGTWLPWDPDAYKTGRVEHLEEELNALHKEKIKNEDLAKQEFEERVRETKKQAIRDNIKKATENNNVLTQTIDEEGTLTGVKETVDFDSREPTTIEGSQLRNEEALKHILKQQHDATEKTEE
tara:strand:- start:3287 stop:4168 length:882 start_codon:yes stop_codon:yes gene_type:complete